MKIPYIAYPLILGLMAGWLGAVLIKSSVTAPMPMPEVLVKKAEKSPSPRAAAKEIIDKNIFSLEIKPLPAEAEYAGTEGTAGKESGGVYVSSGSSPSFTAKLLGIVKDPEGRKSIVIVSGEGGAVSLRMGAEKDGLKLLSVEGLSAVVEKNGRKYTLALERGETSAGNIRNSSNSRGSGGLQTGSNINIGLNRGEVRSELKDLNKILQSALVSPFYIAGEFTGYRVTKMKDDSPLKKLGLNVGDTITRINGNELKSPEILFNMLSQIDDISAISIDMIRNNEKKTIFVEIQ